MEDKIRSFLSEERLSKYADDLLKLARNSIRVRYQAVDEDELDIGASKIGGLPDLPAGTDWPFWIRYVDTETGKVLVETPAKPGDKIRTVSSPLSFIAQIKMSDVVPFDAENLLPHTGMLYFFYEAEEQQWGYDPADRGSWKVIFYDGDLSELERSDPPEELEEDYQFASCKVNFVNQVTLPPWESPYTEQMGMTQDEQLRYADVLSAVENLQDVTENNWETVSRLLGHPNQEQGDMLEECQLASNGVYVGGSEGFDAAKAATLRPGATNWQLLFQMGTSDDAGMMWGDMGKIFYWIEKDKLRARDFSNVWLALQCG